MGIKYCRLLLSEAQRNVFLYRHPELVSGSKPIHKEFKLAGYTYILSDSKRTTLYIGVTKYLLRRLEEHKAGLGSEFASKYKCDVLVYYERFENIYNAIEREKQLKRWHRDWKIDLIKKVNPELRDLSYEL
jgi:putative endonuclease